MRKLNLIVVYKDPDTLKPRTKNPRTHSKKQIQQIAESIGSFGFLNPILIDGENGIVAGHGRWEAAKLLGMRDLPAVSVDHLTPAQIRAYVIADNRLAENAGWDRELLALELKELSVELDFDIQVTGFETPEIDILIAELGDDMPDDADEVPEIDRSRPAVTHSGDRLEEKEERVVLTIPVRLRLHGGIKRVEGWDQADWKTPTDRHDVALIKALAQAHEWRELIERGEILTLEDLVERTKHDRSYVRRILKFAFLAPDIQRAILTGRQPKSLTLAALADIDLPLLWQSQRTLLSAASA